MESMPADSSLPVSRVFHGTETDRTRGSDNVFVTAQFHVCQSSAHATNQQLDSQHIIFFAVLPCSLEDLAQIMLMNASLACYRENC